MILRYFVRLPFEILVRIDDEFRPLGFKYEGHEIAIYPMLQFSHLAALPGLPIPVYPVAKVPPDGLSDVLLNGKPAVPVDLLVIDVKAPLLDRPKLGDHKGTSGSLQIAADFADLVLYRLQNLTRSSNIRLLNGDCSSMFVCLEDDGHTMVPPDDVHSRAGTFSGSRRYSNTVITPPLWDRVTEDVPRLPLHRLLVLRAQSISPEATALVLAFTAVEMTARLLVNETANASLSPEEAAKITNPKRYRARAVERILKEDFARLTGVKLQQQSDFWRAFLDLASARSSLVHDGYPSVGGKHVTSVDVFDLVNKSDMIVGKLESLLPPSSASSVQLENPKAESSIGIGLQVTQSVSLWHLRTRVPFSPPAPNDTVAGVDDANEKASLS